MFLFEVGHKKTVDIIHLPLSQHPLSYHRCNSLCVVLYTLCHLVRKSTVDKTKEEDDEEEERNILGHCRINKKQTNIKTDLNHEPHFFIRCRCCRHRRFCCCCYCCCVRVKYITLWALWMCFISRCCFVLESKHFIIIRIT